MCYKTAPGTYTAEAGTFRLITALQLVATARLKLESRISEAGYKKYQIHHPIYHSLRSLL